MSVQYEDYYKILGVSRSATQQEIQKAFKKQAKKYHPDVSKEPDAEAQFKRANEAYEVLKDPATRQQYDTLGSGYKSGQNFRPPPGWGGGGAGGQNVRFEDLFGGQSAGFSDFFKVFMGGMGGAPGAQQQRAGYSQGADPFAGFGAGPQPPRPRSVKKRGKTHELDFDVPLKILYLNAKHGFEVRRRSGETKSYTIKVPKGSTQASQIKLSKQGDEGTGGGARGDLVLTIKVTELDGFEVDGFNLVRQLDVAPWEVAFGAKVGFETPDGQTVQIKIPAGLKAGSKLRLKQKGLMRDDGTRGALYVVPRVSIPTDLSAREQELYRELEACRA